MRRRVAAITWALLCALLLAGCANRGLTRYEKITKRASSGEFLEAASALRKNKADLYGSRSDLLYNLDLGILYHYAGRHDSSIVFLERAARIHDDLFTRSVSNEAAALLANDNLRPYRGRPYELVWMRVMQSFNYLATGNLDGARVEIRQAQLLMDEFRRTAGKGDAAYRDDPLFRGTAAMVYAALGETDDAAISAYHAVKHYRDADRRPPAGLAAFACRQLAAADRRDDIRLLKLDCTVPGARSPGRDSGEVVVVGLVGRSPALGETVFWGTWIRDGMLVYHYRDANGKTVTDALPAPGLPPSEAQRGNTRSGTTLTIKWAMPSLREVPSQADALRVSTPAGEVEGEAWGDTRALLENDLDANRTALLLRTVTRVVVRTLATEKAKAEMRTDNPWLNLLTNLGADFLSGQLEQADVRMWFLLPRTVQVARVALPAGTHTVQLGATGSSGRTVEAQTRTVDVRAGRTSFVFFSAPR